MDVDLARNPKQEHFFNTAVEAVYGSNDYRYLFYGGAIRGGKSFVCAALWLFFAKIFPKSRWHVIRADFPALSKTTIPTFEKIIGDNKDWKWSRDKSNYYVENLKSKSRIFFMGEGIIQDPELNNFLGLESNGIWLEQIEELSLSLFDMAISRCGSWYIDPMPKPLILGTFNPTQTWVKKKIYEPSVKGELKAPYFFLQALPDDNAFVTKEQWAGWSNMADRYIDQFIKGDWTDFSDKNKRWAFAYDPKKHSGMPVLNRNQIVYLSFDFNKNPISCSVIQHYDGKIRVLRTIKLANSDIYALCDRIIVLYPNCLFMITGDATGQITSALVKDNLNYYKVIMTKLNVGMNQLKVPTFNPNIEDNQVLVNSLLANYPVEIHEEEAAGLHYDMANVSLSADNKIEKSVRADPTQQADALDTFRYFCNAFMGDYLKLL